ncbi:MAG TPA: cytochrome P450 [Vicinamibacteria bacterium]|nr:cytochrome P450 [Vicinamibacteria bacterium]
MSALPAEPLALPPLSALPRPPLARPLIGTAVALVRDALSAFVAGYHRFGPIFRVVVPGRRYVVMAGPGANAFLLRGGERHLAARPVYERLARQLASENYPVASAGERHRQLRRTLKPAFSREAISSYVPRLAEVATRAARSWEPGQRVRVMPAMRRIAGDQLGIALANRPLGERFPDALTFSRISVGAGLGSYPAILHHAPWYRAARRRLFGFLRETVAAHRAEEPGASREPDLIDLLLAASDHEGRPLSEQDVVANAQMAYSNSLLYTAPAAASLVYALARHPEVMRQATAEVDEHFGPRPTIETLKRMTTLAGAVKESMRLYPIALTVPRVAAEPFEFEGHRVEKGDYVLVATTVCHFLPEYFPDPYRFDPARYREPRNEHFRPGAFAPFGLGAHPCLGAGLVEILVTVTAAAVLRNLSITLDPPGYTLRRVVNPFPEPEEGFAVRVVERRSPGPAVTMPSAPAPEQISDVLPALSGEQIARLVSHVARLRFQTGEVIIREGDRADRFYILAAGEVEVVKEPPGRPPQVVHRLRTGDYFGEIGLLQNVRRTATVRAATPVEALALDRETFTSLVAESDLTSSEIGALVRRRVMSTHLALALPRLSTRQVAEVVPRFATEVFPPGAVIIRQGDPPRSFFVVLRGTVEVVNHHPAGDIVIGSLGPGDYFGEMGLLQGRPRSATVRAGAEGEVEVMVLDEAAFRALMTESEEASQDVARRMAERLVALGASTSPP